MAILRDCLPEHVNVHNGFMALPKRLAQRLLADDSAVPLTGDVHFDTKADYLPAATCIFQPRSQMRLWIGGHRAADNLSVLRHHGIMAKLCVAGTHGEGGYRIQDFSSHGVQELLPFCINRNISGVNGDDPLAWEELEKFCDYVWGQLGAKMDLLVYCQQGANRSALAIMIFICWVTHRTTEQVL